MTAESESSIDIDVLKTGNHTKDSDSPKNTRKRTERREKSISREDKSESEVDADLDSSLSTESSCDSFTSDVPVSVYQSLKLKYNDCRKKLLDEHVKAARLKIKNQELKKEIQNLENKINAYADRRQDLQTKKTTGKRQVKSAFNYPKLFSIEDKAPIFNL